MAHESLIRIRDYDYQGVTSDHSEALNDKTYVSSGNRIVPAIIIYSIITFILPE